MKNPPYFIGVITVKVIYLPWIIPNTKEKRRLGRMVVFRFYALNALTFEFEKMKYKEVRYSTASVYKYRIKRNQNRLNRLDKVVFCFQAYPKFPLKVIVVVGDSVRQK